jgi:hypothetical protein
MDLDHLTLSPYQVSLLYKKSLVITGERLVQRVGVRGAETPAPAQRAVPVSVSPPAPSPEPLKYLGENKRHILLLVRDPEAVYLEEKSFNFLVSILNACGLSMEAVALVNTSRTGDRSLGDIAGELDSRVVLLFGIDPGELELPAALATYEIRAIGDKTYLCADELASIERERTQKGRLWACLKQLFQL